MRRFSPRIPRHALAGVARGDAGAFTFEGGGERAGEQRSADYRNARVRSHLTVTTQHLNHSNLPPRDARRSPPKTFANRQPGVITPDATHDRFSAKSACRWRGISEAVAKK